MPAPAEQMLDMHANCAAGMQALLQEPPPSSDRHASDAYWDGISRLNAANRSMMQGMLDSLMGNSGPVCDGCNQAAVGLRRCSRCK